MKEDRGQIVALLYIKVNKGKLTDAERKKLDAWISRSEYNQKLYDEATNSSSMHCELKSVLSYNHNTLCRKIISLITTNKNKPSGKTRFIPIFLNPP